MTMARSGAMLQVSEASAYEPAASQHENQAEDHRDEGQVPFDAGNHGGDHKAEDPKYNYESQGQGGGAGEGSFDGTTATWLVLIEDEQRQVGGEQRESARVDGGQQAGA
jgi:hypothetical protein